MLYRPALHGNWNAPSLARRALKDKFPPTPTVPLTTVLQNRQVFLPLLLPAAIAAGSSNDVTNTSCCRYNCMRSWWWVEVQDETCRAVFRYNKLCNFASCWIYIGITLQTCIRPSRFVTPWLSVQILAKCIQTARHYRMFRCCGLHPASYSCIEIMFLSDGFRSLAQSLLENAAIVLRRVTSIRYFQAFPSASFVFILCYATRNVCVGLSIIKWSQKPSQMYQSGWWMNI
jgi:hypothetical protein